MITYVCNARSRVLLHPALMVIWHGEVASFVGRLSLGMSYDAALKDMDAIFMGPVY